MARKAIQGDVLVIGQLRHRVSIQTEGGDPDDYGEVIPSWTTSATRWAAVEPLTGREFWASQQLKSEVSHKVTMRGGISITPDMRLLFDSRPFDVISVRDIDERGQWIEVLAKERLT